MFRARGQAEQYGVWHEFTGFATLPYARASDADDRLLIMELLYGTSV